MDFLKDFINEHGGALIEQLKGAGFSAGQAEEFIPAAGEEIVGALKQTDPSALMDDEPDAQISKLAGNIDIGGLAARLGIDSNVAQNGLQQVIPPLMGFLKDHAGAAGGILSMLGGAKAGGIGATLGKLAGSLFRH